MKRFIEIFGTKPFTSTAEHRRSVQPEGCAMPKTLKKKKLLPFHEFENYTCYYNGKNLAASTAKFVNGPIHALSGTCQRKHYTVFKFILKTRAKVSYYWMSSTRHILTERGLVVCKTTREKCRDKVSKQTSFLSGKQARNKLLS